MSVYTDDKNMLYEKTSKLEYIENNNNGNIGLAGVVTYEQIQLVKKFIIVCGFKGLTDYETEFGGCDITEEITNKLNLLASEIDKHFPMYEINLKRTNLKFTSVTLIMNTLRTLLTFIGIRWKSRRVRSNILIKILSDDEQEQVHDMITNVNNQDDSSSSYTPYTPYEFVKREINRCHFDKSFQDDVVAYVSSSDYPWLNYKSKTLSFNIYDKNNKIVEGLRYEIIVDGLLWHSNTYTHGSDSASTFDSTSTSTYNIFSFLGCNIPYIDNSISILIIFYNVNSYQIIDKIIVEQEYYTNNNSVSINSDFVYNYHCNNTEYMIEKFNNTTKIINYSLNIVKKLSEDHSQLLNIIPENNIITITDEQRRINSKNLSLYAVNDVMAYLMRHKLFVYVHEQIVYKFKMSINNHINQINDQILIDMLRMCDYVQDVSFTCTSIPSNTFIPSISSNTFIPFIPSNTSNNLELLVINNNLEQIIMEKDRVIVMCNNVNLNSTFFIINNGMKTTEYIADIEIKFTKCFAHTSVRQIIKNKSFLTKQYIESL